MGSIPPLSGTPAPAWSGPPRSWLAAPAQSSGGPSTGQRLVRRCTRQMLQQLTAGYFTRQALVKRSVTADRGGLTDRLADAASLKEGGSEYGGRGLGHPFVGDHGGVDRF